MEPETFKNLLPNFISSLEGKGRSPSTLLAYRADLEQLIKFLQDRNIVTTGQVKQEDIEAYI